MKISREQKKAIKNIAEKYKLSLIMVFGSFAAGNDRVDSDLDIAIVSRQTIDIDRLAKLSTTFGLLFGKEIDISVMNHANPLHLNQVAKNSQLVFGSQKDFIAFKLGAFHQFNDFTPYFKLEYENNKKIINQYVSR